MLPRTPPGRLLPGCCRAKLGFSPAMWWRGTRSRSGCSLGALKTRSRCERLRPRRWRCTTPPTCSSGCGRSKCGSGCASIRPDLGLNLPLTPVAAARKPTDGTFRSWCSDQPSTGSATAGRNGHVVSERNIMSFGMSRLSSVGVTARTRRRGVLAALVLAATLATALVINLSPAAEAAPHPLADRPDRTDPPTVARRYGASLWGESGR